MTEHEAVPSTRRAGERGSATLTAVLVMGLLIVIAALALARTTTEALIMGNDSSQTRSFYAAQASLEVMTRNFNKIFDSQINPSQNDLNNLQNNAGIQNAGWQALFPGYTFNQQVFPNNINQINTRNVTIAGGPYEGLRAARDTWQFVTTATGPSGAQVQLTRSFFSNRLPIFQFGVFYEGDMDFWPGPAMYMGGRVHTNGNLFLCGSAGLYFLNRVTAVGEIVHDNARNGGSMYYIDNVFVTDGQGGNIQVTQGSVIGGPNVGGNQPEHFAGVQNANWTAFRAAFNNNLQARAPRLRMPLQLSGADPIQLIKRGSAADNVLIASSRYYNKASIRISLSDTKDQLPNCNGVAGSCGRRLDGASNGLGADADANGSRGYLPRAMTGPAYQAARVNGHRIYGSNATWTAQGGGTRQTWIKVELVTPNAANPAVPNIVDVTEDFLSLGLTEDDTFPLAAGGTTTLGDSLAIIKIQRFMVAGPPLKVNDVHSTVVNTAASTIVPNQSVVANRPLFHYSTANYNVVTGLSALIANAETNHLVPAGAPTVRTVTTAGNIDADLVPFPIMMYDVREGLYNDDITNASWDTLYKTGGGVNSNDNVPWRGVLSLVDIDMNNFRRLVNGEFNGRFPNNVLTSTILPRDPQGYILYVSDRRGDVDNDGVYDMENIYVANANDNSVGAGAGLQAGEDLSGTGNGGMTPDGLLQADYTWESARYSDAVPSDLAAVTEQPWPVAITSAPMPVGYNFGHRHYRRAVRLINGSNLWAPPALSATQGIAVATENGAYILGDYNSTGANNPPGGGLPTPPSGFLGNFVPTSVSADAITILSKAWNDAKSFRNPLRLNSPLGRVHGRGIDAADETTVRTALLMGVTKSSLLTNPNQGGGAGPAGGTLRNSDGGVNNFPRLLEDWGTNGVQLNYLGSMISLFFSRNNNGSFKGHNGSGTQVITFLAPSRNWNFDTTFLEPTQNPPGTPFLQYVQVTGFRQTNN